jgi:hypothetical protein
MVRIKHESDEPPFAPFQTVTHSTNNDEGVIAGVVDAHAWIAVPRMTAFGGIQLYQIKGPIPVAEIVARPRRRGEFGHEIVEAMAVQVERKRLKAEAMAERERPEAPPRWLRRG